MPVSLTETAIAKAVQNAAAVGRRELADAGCPGLRLRISRKGKRVWLLACRDHLGKMRRFSLGTHPEMRLSAARSAARALHVEVKIRGADPIAERRQKKALFAAGTSGVNSLAALLGIYGEKVGARKKTWKEARRRIEIVFGRLLDKALADLTRSELQIVADNYNAVMSASAAVRYLRPILKWGSQRGYVAGELANVHPPATVQRRKRILSETELGQVLAAVRSSDRPAWRMIHFMLLTLARREEAARARWRDIDWVQSLWHIPETKNDMAHSVPLSAQALTLLKEMHSNGTDLGCLIFSTRTGGPLSNWDRETKKLHEATGTSDWHRHDLRRTGATILGNLGELPDIVEAALNHVNIRSSLAATYNRARYTPQVRQALQRLGDYLDGLKQGAAGKSEKILVDVEIARVTDLYVSLVEHLHKLNRRLDQGGGEIEVCLDAVVAVKRFLDANEMVMASELTRPFAMLAAALRDLCSGVKPKLFEMKKQKIHHRPAGASDIVSIQATAAAGLELLHHYGDSFDNAASFIVRELEKVGITHTGTKRPITRETIRGWRNEMGGKNPEASYAIYRKIVDDTIKSLGPKASTNQAKRVVIGSISALSAEGIRGRKSD